MMEYKDVEEGYAKKLVGSYRPLLLVTATAVETTELHKHLSPVEGSHLIECYKGSTKYYLGLFGKYLVVHVECLRMGTGQQGGSLETCSEAINQWRPAAVVMVGIAFGVKPNEQRIGDVLISESTIPYEIAKLAKGDIQYRAAIPPAGNTLLSRFKHNRTWQHSLPSGQMAKKLPGAMLSGEKLIDDLAERDALVKDHPHAIGGEMEGNGVASAAHDDHLEWILVKAICDFADGNKAVNKEQNQAIAASASVSLCLDVFSSEVAFKELGLLPWKAVTIVVDSSKAPVQYVLFDKYTLTAEPFYIERPLDAEVRAGLKYYGLWLHGASGMGKSSVAMRNLLQGKYQFVQITLANCQDIDEFFQFILAELQVTLGIPPQQGKVGYVETTKLIHHLLHETYPGKEVVLYLEEIPISTAEDYREFTRKLIAHIISDDRRGENDAQVKYVLSSIQNPEVHILDYHMKVKERMLFVPVAEWQAQEIITLVERVAESLGMSENDFSELVQKATGSPRFCKKAFRNMLVGIDATGQLDVSAAVTRTLTELRP